MKNSFFHQITRSLVQISYSSKRILVLRKNIQRLFRKDNRSQKCVVNVPLPYKYCAVKGLLHTMCFSSVQFNLCVFFVCSGVKQLSGFIFCFFNSATPKTAFFRFFAGFYKRRRSQITAIFWLFLLLAKTSSHAKFQR